MESNKPRELWQRILVILSVLANVITAATFIFRDSLIWLGHWLLWSWLAILVIGLSAYLFIHIRRLNSKIRKLEEHLSSANTKTNDGDLLSFINIFERSTFGTRLGVRRNIKKALANFAVERFIHSQCSSIFVESGTLSVFLMLKLMQRHPSFQDICIVTNNIAAAIVAIAREKTATGLLHHVDKIREWEAHWPKDNPTKVHLIEGTVLDDYCATIPAALLDSVSGLNEDEGFRKVIDTLKERKVAHVIMMITSFDAEMGPRAVSAGMRNFKKCLMKYVIDNREVHLTILGEVQKLLGPCVRGKPASPQYWMKLKGQRRVSVILGCPDGYEEGNILQARKILRDIESSGATTFLVNENGYEIR
jgi:hypothetical protein